MNRVNFETLKKNVARELVNNLDWNIVAMLCLQDHIDRTQLETMLNNKDSIDGHPTRCNRHFESVFKKYQKLIFDTVMRTDIRCIDKLIEMSKNKMIFPKFIRDGYYSIDMDGNDWYIVKKEV